MLADAMHCPGPVMFVDYYSVWLLCIPGSCRDGTVVLI